METTHSVLTSGGRKERVFYEYIDTNEINPPLIMYIRASLTHCFKCRQWIEMGTSQALSLGPSWFSDKLHYRLLESKAVTSL